MKKLMFVTMFLITALMAGCAQPATLPPVSEGTGQQPAVATAVPPTNTPVPPTPTFTPTPVPTLKDIVTQAGFTPATPLFQKGFKIENLLEVNDSQSYQKGNAYIHIILFPLPTQLELAGFDIELQNPSLTLQAIATALKGVGVDAKEDLSGKTVGDSSKGVSFQTNISGVNHVVDVVLFRKGNQGAMVVVMAPESEKAPIDVFDVAVKLAEEMK